MSEPWVCGLDLGQTADRSALACLQVIQGKTRGLNVYELLFLERFKLGTPYPEIGQRLLKVFGAAPLAGSTLAVDGTGVGRGVVDFFKHLSGLKAALKPVTITGGLQASRADDGYWHIAKANLVSAARMVMQTRRIEFAPDLPDLRVLKTELTNFQVKISKAAHELYEAREGENDDLVLAVAMALWFGENIFTGPWEYKPDPRARTAYASAPPGAFDIQEKRED